MKISKKKAAIVATTAPKRNGADGFILSHKNPAIKLADSIIRLEDQKEYYKICYHDTNMTNEEIIEKIQAKYPAYLQNKTNTLSSSLEKMSPIIKKALEAYLQTGENDEINLLGMTVEKLKTDHGMNEIAAYLTLDWLIREPEKALESLKRGHDFVSFSKS